MVFSRQYVLIVETTARNQNIGIGDTPNDALYDLIRKLGSGSNIGETIAMAIPTFPYLPD